MTENGQSYIFAAKLYRLGPIRFVDVPPEVSKSLGTELACVPVCGTVEGVPLRTTLVPRGKGRHRLAIHGDIRKKLRIDAGAVVEISIELDEESREPVLPPLLVVALKYAPRASKTFRGMTTALRRQIVRYLTAPKNVETVERRVAKFVALLESGRHHTQTKKYSKRLRKRQRE
ncbi:MAG TPA: YdeI/OmpD-associated family protein [Candidatus Acidoferrum sp.]|nr:YdeI/OmpD-associated family protein [Candidatus Acidoferrum sp.]